MTERTVAITRLMPAPRERVFEAWTQARHLERWFAPTRFTLHSCGAYREARRPERLQRPGDGAKRMVDGMPKGWSQTLARLHTQFNTET